MRFGGLNGIQRRARTESLALDRGAHLQQSVGLSEPQPAALHDGVTRRVVYDQEVLTNPVVGDEESHRQARHDAGLLPEGDGPTHGGQ